MSIIVEQRVYEQSVVAAGVYGTVRLSNVRKTRNPAGESLEEVKNNTSTSDSNVKSKKTRRKREIK